MSRNLKMPWSMKDTVENMERIRDIMIKKVRQINLDGKAEEDVREVNFDFNRVKVTILLPERQSLQSVKRKRPENGSENQSRKRLIIS